MGLSSSIFGVKKEHIQNHQLVIDEDFTKIDLKQQKEWARNFRKLTIESIGSKQVFFSELGILQIDALEMSSTCAEV